MDLQQQANKLQRQIVNREKRRAQQGGRNQDAYEDNKPRKKRAEPLKAAQQAYAAVMAAAALTPQPVQRCELCQASFITDAQLQQHLEGPVHKKAVEKAAREAAKLQHINQHSAVAQDALAAAAWLGGSSAGNAARGGSHRPQPQQQQQGRQEGRQEGRQQQQQKGRQQGRVPPASREEQLTHEQVLAAAKQDSGPLSLDGWVPPNVPAQPTPQAQQQGQPDATQAGALHEPVPHNAAAAGDSHPSTGADARPSQSAAAAADEVAGQQGAEAGADGGGGGSGSGSGSSSGSESDDDADLPQTFESFF